MYIRDRAKAFLVSDEAYDKRRDELGWSLGDKMCIRDSYKSIYSFKSVTMEKRKKTVFVSFASQKGGVGKDVYKRQG